MSVPSLLQHTFRHPSAPSAVEVEVGSEDCYESEGYEQVGISMFYMFGRLNLMKCIRYRLNVLRAVLAETTNASKTTSPVRTDIQLLSLIRKRIAASKSAAEEFSAANRDDLRDKEQAQVVVMEEYAAGVETVGQDEITEVVARIIGKMRTDGLIVNTGSALKALVGPGGEFEGKPVDKAEVARIVKRML